MVVLAQATCSLNGLFQPMEITAAMMIISATNRILREWQDVSAEAIELTTRRSKQMARKSAGDGVGSGGKGIRTPGLLIANETLYQLSYTPVYPTTTESEHTAENSLCPLIFLQYGTRICAGGELV